MSAARSLVVAENLSVEGASQPWTSPAQPLLECILVVDTEALLRDGLARQLASFCHGVLAIDPYDFKAVQGALELRPDLVVCGFDRRRALVVVSENVALVQVRATAQGELFGVLVRGKVPAPLSMDSIDEAARRALVLSPALARQMLARALTVDRLASDMGRLAALLGSSL